MLLSSFHVFIFIHPIVLCSNYFDYYPTVDIIFCSTLNLSFPSSLPPFSISSERAVCLHCEVYSVAQRTQVMCRLQLGMVPWSAEVPPPAWEHPVLQPWRYWTLGYVYMYLTSMTKEFFLTCSTIPRLDTLVALSFAIFIGWEWLSIGTAWDSLRL